jgi:hypothetical protein
MKPSLKKVLGTMMILSLAVACGKKESSGSNPYAIQNPLYDMNTLGSTGSQALSNLQAWASSNQENESIGRVGTYLRKSQSISTGFSFSFDFNFSLFGSSGTAPSGCYVGTPENQIYNVGTPSNGQCINQVRMLKSDNQALREAISGKNQTLQLINISQTGPRFVLTYAQSGSISATPAAIYVIDTSKHSIFNPVKIIDYVNRKQDDYLGRQTSF